MARSGQLKTRTTTPNEGLACISEPGVYDTRRWNQGWNTIGTIWAQHFWACAAAVGYSVVLMDTDATASMWVPPKASSLRLKQRPNLILLDSFGFKVKRGRSCLVTLGWVVVISSLADFPSIFCGFMKMCMTPLFNACETLLKSVCRFTGRGFIVCWLTRCDL